MTEAKTKYLGFGEYRKRTTIRAAQFPDEALKGIVITPWGPEAKERCPWCGQPMSRHGRLLKPANENVDTFICPGDYVCAMGNGYAVMARDYFESQYE